MFRCLVIPIITLSIMYCTLWLFYRLSDWKGLDTEVITTGSAMDQQLLLRSELMVDKGQVDKNMPLFYFSLLSNALPDEVYSIPLVFRHNFEELCHQVKDPLLMGQYGSFLSDGLSRFKNHGSEHSLPAKELISLLSVSTIDDFSNIRSSISNNVALQWIDRLSLAGSKDGLKAGKGYRWLWHGRENIFNHQLNLLLGRSASNLDINGQPVYRVFVKSLQWTLSYTIPGFLLAVFLSMYLVITGHMTSVNGRMMRLARFMSLALYSLPTFIICLLALVFLTSHRYGWMSTLFPFPTFYSVEVKHLGEIYMKYGHQLVLPILLFSIWPGIVLFRVFDEKLKTIGEETGINGYLMQMGMNKNIIRFKYLPRFLWVTGMATFSNIFVGLFGGSLILEMIFNLPGLGRWFYDAILMLDINTTLFLVVFFTILHQVGHLISDMVISTVVYGSSIRKNKGGGI